MESQTKNCQNCKKDFEIEAEDFGFYEKIKVPFPTFCPMCRAQRRMAFRNERLLFKRKSDFSGREIFSMYADPEYKVYEKDVWLSDQWNPLDYGQEYDFSRPFFEQFNELLHKVPLKNLNLVNPVRSDYSNNFTEPKNCYLCFNGTTCEDSMYSHGMNISKDCVDVSHVSKCETCYDSFWITSGKNNIGCSNCDSSYNMWFSKDCVGCSDCVGCVGLRKKQYHIFNKPYSKEEYAAKIKELNLDSRIGYEKVKNEAKKFWLSFPVKFLEGLHNTQVSGNYINHSKNVRNSFLVREGENLKFCQYLQEDVGSKDSYDWSIWGDNGELVYECHACGIGVQNIHFCLFTQEDVRDTEYSMIVSGSSHLFGCVGLRKKEYCILNKQYSREEYEALVPKIREHMKTMPYKDKAGRLYSYGEYFPIEISPVAYNESMAQEYFPLSKKEAIRQGYKWQDTAERNYKPTIENKDIPDRITEVKDSITSEILACAHKDKDCNQLCTKAFRIIPDELNFYRKLGLPIPVLCPNCRTFERLSERTGLKTYSRTCDCKGETSVNEAYANTGTHAHGSEPCDNRFETAYGPDRKEIVYCENCYLSEVS